MANEAPVVNQPAPQGPAVSGPTQPSAESVSTPKTYSESEYQAVQTELAEHRRQIASVSQFVETDPEVKQRLNLYAESFKNNKSYTDMVKDWESKKTAQQAPERPKTESGLTPEQIRAMVRGEAENMLKPFTETQANNLLKESKESILKENTWATDKDWETYDQRFNEVVGQKADKVFQDNYPNLTKQQAWEKAVGSFVDVDDKILFDALMKPEREEAILGKRRMAPKLPDGMVDTVSTGKDPDLLDKARKAYSAIEGDGDKVASLIKEYAPQFGVSADDRAGVQKLYSLITKS